MPQFTDIFRFVAEKGATVFEREPYTWSPVVQNPAGSRNPEIAIGGMYMAAYMRFQETNVSAGGYVYASVSGLKPITAQLDVWMRYSPHTSNGYAGSIYALTEYVDPDIAWWANLSAKLSRRSYGTVSAPHTADYIGGELFDLSLESGAEGAAVITDILKNGLVLRASFSSTMEVNRLTYYKFAGNCPQLWVEMSSVPIEIGEVTPGNGGYINPTTGGRLSWTLSYDDTGVFGTVEQDSAKVQIRHGAEGEGTEYTVSGADMSFAVTPEMAAESFQWRVQASTRWHEESPWSAWSQVSVVDSLSTPVALAPINQIVEGGGAREFKWWHDIPTGTAPTGWKLQYSVNRTDWIDLSAGNDDATGAWVELAAIPAGTMYWRVQTANADGVFGNWSEPAMLVIRDAPPLPVVAVTGNTIPTITWQSYGQQGYEVMIDGDCTGVRYGADRSYTWDRILEDGEHRVQVRVINQFGLCSPWASAVHTVRNVPSAIIPSIQAITEDRLTVAVSWSGETDARTLIYRDGALLVETDAKGLWVDNTATDRHQYFVRRVDQKGNYTDSESVVVALRMRDPAIAVLGEWNWVRLTYSEGSVPVRDTASAAVYALNHYSGRALPVAEIGMQRTTAHDLEYALFDPRDAAKVRDMLGKVVCFKRQGEVLIGLLTSLAETRTEFAYNERLHIEEVSL